MNPTQAIHNRDPDALDAAFSSLEAATQFRNEVLPTMSPADAKWFWQQVMSPEQLTRTLDAVRDVCLAIADEMELLPNVHYSLGMVDDLPTLVCPEAVSRVFYARLAPERHSILRFYLQITT
jgi:hypothetical protein